MKKSATPIQIFRPGKFFCNCLDTFCHGNKLFHVPNDSATLPQKSYILQNTHTQCLLWSQNFPLPKNICICFCQIFPIWLWREEIGVHVQRKRKNESLRLLFLSPCVCVNIRLCTEYGKARRVESKSNYPEDG